MPKKSLLPFLVLGGGFAWYGLLAWLRRRSQHQNRGSSVAPGTHFLTLVGALGLLIAVVAAAVVAIRIW